MIEQFYFKIARVTSLADTRHVGASAMYSRYQAPCERTFTVEMVKPQSSSALKYGNRSYYDTTQGSVKPPCSLRRAISIMSFMRLT